jgi:uncharacterized protein (TIGR02147 family)
MNHNLFDFMNYRDFLAESLEPRGTKLSLSKHLRCQSAYISRILAGQADLSLEQAIQTTEFLELSAQEKDYFVMLVHCEKAGTAELKNYYLSKIKDIRKNRDEVASKLKERTTITEEQENILFSSWIYNAVTVAVRIPELRTRKQLLKYFKLEPEHLHAVVDFLLSIGLLKENDGQLSSGPAHIHQSKNSPNTTKSQVNWRLQALQSLNNRKENDLHFCGVYSLSLSAAVEIRRILLKSIDDLDETVRPSNDETLYSLCIDWFKV